ncbi:MAG: Eco57I restriction-modification methylase domain-containing protein [Coriobacteriaceae bacterium]|jgi:methylase of polypeptide subunit release factors|nr:Eco57I restriction-modification methylase domain-containing protein [Coriobacteriaceae bacterium]
MSNAIEQKRRIEQKLLDKARDTEYRRRLGQFATPFEMAQEIAAYSVSLLNSQQIRFLEPAVGTGAFYSAVLALEGRPEITEALGFEIDDEVVHAARRIWDNGIKIINADFTRETPDSKQINLLISNPPYVRHHYLATDEKMRMQRIIESTLGIHVSGLSGLYCYFMLLAHKWLDANAVSAWLVPSEFMDVNYGAAVKRYLLDKVRLVRIHRYDPAKLMFDDALVSSAVVWFVNEPTAEDYPVEFTFGGTIENPDQHKTLQRSLLSVERKWTRFPEHDTRQLISSQPKIKDVFEVKRGIATGDNSFFILDKNKVDALGLKHDYLTPIIPSPRHLDVTELFADESGNPKIESPLYLIDCNLPEHLIKTLYPELFDYLQSGIGSVSNRYLCKAKRCWYQQEQRKPAPILCTYMGRGAKGGAAPFRFILNHSRAIATNSYLMLYPKEAYRLTLATNPSILKNIWTGLNNLPAEHLVSEGRVYGGGLKKIEPKELGEVVCTGSFEPLSLELDFAAG